MRLRSAILFRAIDGGTLRLMLSSWSAYLDRFQKTEERQKTLRLMKCLNSIYPALEVIFWDQLTALLSNADELLETKLILWDLCFQMLENSVKISPKQVSKIFDLLSCELGHDYFRFLHCNLDRVEYQLGACTFDDKDSYQMKLLEVFLWHLKSLLNNFQLNVENVTAKTVDPSSQMYSQKLPSGKEVMRHVTKAAAKLLPFNFQAESSRMKDDMEVLYSEKILILCVGLITDCVVKLRDEKLHSRVIIQTFMEVIILFCQKV